MHYCFQNIGMWHILRKKLKAISGHAKRSYLMSKHCFLLYFLTLLEKLCIYHNTCNQEKSEVEDENEGKKNTLLVRTQEG